MLKLGGSLITDKNKPYTVRAEVLSDLVRQVKGFLADTDHAKRADGTDARGRHRSLILGHGSGSFGHSAAAEHGTFHGSASLPDSGEKRAKFWDGFAEVRFRAAQLNALVMTEMHRARIPAIAIPPSSTVVCRDREIVRWDLEVVRMSLAVGLVPVLYGDVVFDEVLGATILSTEDLFVHVARELQPERVLLAGLEPGVWADFPARTRLLDQITPASFEKFEPAVAGSASIDVTGGMGAKVRQMLELAQELPGLDVQIFSGAAEAAIEKALDGSQLGTWIHADLSDRKSSSRIKGR
jgi:isopentenyl phosphate kinase